MNVFFYCLTLQAQAKEGNIHSELAPSYINVFGDFWLSDRQVVAGMISFRLG